MLHIQSPEPCAPAGVAIWLGGFMWAFGFSAGVETTGLGVAGTGVAAGSSGLELQPEQRSTAAAAAAVETVNSRVGEGWHFMDAAACKHARMDCATFRMRRKWNLLRCRRWSQIAALCGFPLYVLPSSAASSPSPLSRPRQKILVKSGDKVAFLGDSITAQGWSSPVGYVRLVIAGLEANGVKAVPIPAGIGGHKSNQMLARLQKDVLDKQPQWMTLSCG